MTDVRDAEVDAPPGRHDARPYVLGLLYAVVAAVALRPALDHDLWWHLRTAQWMVQHHDWVGVDPFQHTRPGIVRVQTDWLADLSYYGVWRTLGLPGVSLLMATLATIGTAFVHGATSGRFGVRVAVTALVAAAASIHWVSRPEMFTFALTAAIVALLAHARTDRRIWLLVPLVLLGSNLHGGIVYAVLIVLASVAGEWGNLVLGRPRLSSADRHRLTAVAALAVAVMAVNPSGVRLYGMPFHQVDTAVKYVTEFRHPSLTDPWAWPFFLLLGLTVVLVARSWRRVDLAAALPVLVTAALGLQFVRSVGFFAVAAAPLVSTLGSAWWAERRPDDAPPTLTDHDARRLRQAVALVVLAVVVTAPFRISGSRIDDQKAQMFPVHAAAWLAEHDPPGRLFNEFDWGGYLILYAQEHPVSIDGRTDVYDEYLEVAVETAMARGDWEAELDREGIGTVLVRKEIPLAIALRDHPGWTLAHEDDVAVIYTRA